VAKRMQPAAEVMGCDTGLSLRAGQATRRVGQPGSELA